MYCLQLLRMNYTSLNNLDVEIQILELEIAKLRLGLAEKQKQKEVLQELQSSDSLGIDRHGQPIYTGDTVELLTLSRKGEFKGEDRAIVLGRSKGYTRRILIEKNWK